MLRWVQRSEIRDCSLNILPFVCSAGLSGWAKMSWGSVDSSAVILKLADWFRSKGLPCWSGKNVLERILDSSSFLVPENSSQQSDNSKIKEQQV